MPLRLHRSERSDVLADALGEVLRTPLADPFATEVVAVPAKGVERWLTQRLAGVLGAVDGDGVAAGIAFPSPARLVDEAVAAAGGWLAEDDPWAPPRVLWTLLDVVDGCLDEPWCAVLAGHLGGGRDEHRAGRRYASVEHLRDLYRSYEAHRPAMLVDWALGDDTDGAGAPLPEDLRWQAELWRRLRAALGADSRAERLGPACERLIADAATSALPERLSLFGATRLTTAQRAVLRALGAHREVHLWLPHAGPALWAALQDASVPARRRDDDSALRVRVPLLAGLSRDVRELQLLLPRDSDRHHPAPPPPATLLGRLQAVLRDDALPDGPAGTADGTVQVHACHGPARQVEVLREALLHLLAQDPTLEPRDVLVMCPDVEAYAPLVRAAFGAPGAGHPGHRLRVRLADRALTRTNPLLDVVAGLLALADGRVTASDVLDLAAAPPVRRAFGLRDDDLERLRDWAARTGVRWGLGVREREAHALGAVPHGTWRTGLDRLLLGVAADESELGWLETALPLDDVDSSDVDLAGRLAELVDRLDDVLTALQGPQPVAAWTAALARGLDLLTEVPEADAWMRAQADRELAEAAEHGSAAPLRLRDVRALLRTRLAGRPTRANFRTGDLTVCTMVPMRSVPHRVVALLGLDDGAFPRAGHVDGDDVLQRDPCLGERDARAEDRQLLLDAVLSAGDALLLLHTGADPVTGAERPPAVPLGELLDLVAELLPEGQDVVRRHPLQPFDPRDFCAPEPFAHDRDALAGARASVRERRPEPPLLSGPLPAVGGDVPLAELVAFAVSPAQAFLAQRLGVRLPQDEEALADALPTSLDGLQKWEVGDRMLAARLAGVDPTTWWQAEVRRGTLPPLRLGSLVVDDLARAVGALADAALPVHVGVPRTVDVDVDLGGGRRLTGTVAGLHAHDDGLVLAATSYSRLAAKHRLTAWVRLLALSAAGAGVVRAVTTGRGPYRGTAQAVVRPPEDPGAVLRDLVALRDEGLRAPLPLAPQAAAAYADRRHHGASLEEAREAAVKAWEDRYGDHTDRHVAYAVGGLDALLAEPGQSEPTRFGELAVRLWTPLLRCEQVGRP